MVFENITLFELNLEGARARFGPSFADDDDAFFEEADEEEESGGRRIGPALGVLVLVAAASALAYWRFRSADDLDEVPTADEQITIENAAEQ